MPTADLAYARMLEGIGSSRTDIRLESYILRADRVGNRFRDALIAAAGRGVRVQVLLDAWGSSGLPGGYWTALTKAGGAFRWFNPLHWASLPFRDHRKLLVCDDTLAFTGGFNLAEEYAGDGVHTGWRDLGVCVGGPSVGVLGESFDRMFDLAGEPQGPFQRVRRSAGPRGLQRTDQGIAVLTGGPGRGFHPIKHALVRAISTGHDLRIMSAYYLPTLRIRRALRRVIRRGGSVTLLVPAVSDVPFSRLAGRALYASLLRQGVQIHEYRPRMLHAKVVIADNTVFVGSANLDTRSLNINHELMLRIQDPTFAQQGRNLFDADLQLSERIDPATWAQSRSAWQKFQERWAYFLLARLDPAIARRQLPTLT